MPKKKGPQLAKLTRPRLYDAVARKRLFKLLDEARKKPVVWVSGPPGSGKTTCLASYLQARKIPAFWFQVDESDRDPATFFYYLTELARQGRGRKRAPLPHLKADYLPDLAGFARRYFRELFQRLAPRAMLVFDNCQDAASETFHLIVREACEEIPAGASLIALSRSGVPDELSRHAANQRLQTVGWEDLRLTEAEAQAIAAGSSGRVAPQEVPALNRQCDGWVGGLVLLLAHAGLGTRTRETQAFDSKESVFGYFAGEVLSRTTPGARDILLRTALFPQTTVAMAEEIKGETDAGKVLNELYRKQYFIDRKVEGELTYQYHDLFREFLLTRLNTEYGEAELADIHRRAAEILDKYGRWAEAAELFKQAQDWASVARLIRAHAESLLDQGRWQTLNSWFERMPEELVHNDPWLTFWRGVGQMTVDVRRGA